jgi:hypothetical protein
VSTQVDPRRLGDRGRFEAVGRRDHPADERMRGAERILLSLQLAQGRDRMAEKSLGFLDDAGGILDPAAAKPALDEVGARAGEAGEPRTQEREQIATASTEPGEAQQPEES